jgi:hypothetical protein
MTGVLAMSEQSESNGHAPRTDGKFKFDLSSEISHRPEEVRNEDSRAWYSREMLDVQLPNLRISNG